jgi:hypothetical protein
MTPATRGVVGPARILTAWVIDTLLAAVLGIAVGSALFNPDAAAREAAITVVVGLGVAAAAAFVHEMLAVRGQPAGGILTRTRIVRAGDHQVPRAFARGFLIFRRSVLWPLWPLLFIAAASTGTADDLLDHRQNYVSIDAGTMRA